MKQLFPLLLVLPLLVLPVVGCHDQHDGPVTFQQTRRKVDCRVVFAVDPTEPYRQHLLKEDGLFSFWVSSISNYKTQLQGVDKDLVIAPAAGDSVTWFHGTPKEFQETYDTPEKLRELLNKTSDLVTPYQGLADTIDYVLRLHENDPADVPVYLVVMSSMADTAEPDKLIRALKRFRQVKSTLAFYWPKRSELPKIDDILQQAGYPKMPWEDSFNPPPIQFK